MSDQTKLNSKRKKKNKKEKEEKKTKEKVGSTVGHVRSNQIESKRKSRSSSQLSLFSSGFVSNKKGPKTQIFAQTGFHEWLHERAEE